MTEQPAVEAQPQKLPVTRIASLFMILNYLAAGLVALAMLLGFAVPLMPDLLYYHIPVGLGAAVLGLFALVSSMFYLIVSGTSIKEAVMTRGIAQEYFDRTKPFKKELFPYCMLTIVLLIAMTVLGAGVHTGVVNRNVHLFFAFATMAAYYYTIKKAGTVFQRNRELIADTLEAIHAARQKENAASPAR